MSRALTVFRQSRIDLAGRKEQKQVKSKPPFGAVSVLEGKNHKARQKAKRVQTVLAHGLILAHKLIWFCAAIWPLKTTPLQS